jgi:hypothetical protein
MNPNNYGTLEACQRLVKAGIVLETEAMWGFTEKKYASGHVDIDWVLVPKTQRIPQTIPAPSMAEVWRELPNEAGGGELRVSKNSIIGDIHVEYVIPYYIEEPDIAIIEINNTNPTDALIDLLIWVKAQKEGV